ncbi:MAG: nucleotidyltransferase [Clostridium sp.]
MITGIITEYNPFHKGHKYHLENAIKDTSASGVVCVMSGNFMQRGIPAIVDKWKRTEMALKNGVDLILELPLVYSISSAEHFAFGSVSLLNSLGIIDNLYFGSEEGNVESLAKISRVLSDEPEEFKTLLKKYLNSGLPFHSSRSKALNEYLKCDDVENILSNSNNILGIEYMKALNVLNSSITPYTLKREGSNYNDENVNKSFSSATSIRKHLKNGCLSDIEDILPEETYKILNEISSSNYPFVFEEDMFNYIKYKLLTEKESLKNLPDVSEGLDNKIYREILNSDSLDQLILKSKSKRYTYTRINRILAQYFLGLEKYDLLSLAKSPAPYARVLGFNSNGRDILKQIKSSSSIDIITKVQKNNRSTHMELDILGTKAYSILNSHVNPADDFLKSPVIIK